MLLFFYHVLQNSVTSLRVCCCSMYRITIDRLSLQVQQVQVQQVQPCGFPFKTQRERQHPTCTA